MKLNNCRISMQINQEETVIELYDYEAHITFAKIKLTPDQLSKVLSRLMYVECKNAEVFDLNKLNKKMLTKPFIFKLPENFLPYSNGLKEMASNIAKEKCPDGWKPDCYFNSQDSFFYNEDSERLHAKTIIRKWVKEKK